MRKTRLDLDRLDVSSFSTTARGHVTAAEAACTCAASCACPSAYYYCNPAAPNTLYSCDYTKNQSCWTPPTA